MIQKIYHYVISRELLLAIVIAIALIGGALFLAYENNKVVSLNPATSAHYLPARPLSFMSNWDGPDYLYIAVHGYGGTYQTNFFPLYPLLIHVVNWLVRSPLYSGLVVSWASLVGSIYFYLKIIKQLFKDVASIETLRALVFFVLFPSGVFLLATYTEGLFSCLALAAIYNCLKRNYILAALLTLLATATHITGLFLVALIALMMLEQKEKLWRAVLTAVTGCLGLVGYIAYLTDRFHKPLAFVGAQRRNGWLHYDFSGLINSFGWVNGLLIVLIIISVIYFWNRRSFSWYSLLFLTIPLFGGQFGGFNRYVLMDFPLQLMLYERTRYSQLAYSFCLALTAILWAYFLFQYAGGYVGG